MSVRIHEIAKAINKDNKEVLEILRSRGFEVKTASSSIDNISAEAFIEEFKVDSSSGQADETASSEEAKGSAAPKVSAPPFRLPAGAIVKSAEDIERERRERDEAERLRQEAELEKRRITRGIQTAQPTTAVPRPAQPPSVPPRPPLRSAPPAVPPRPPIPAAPAARAPSPVPPRPAAQPEVRIHTSPTPPPAVPPRASSTPASVPPPPPRTEAPQVPARAGAESTVAQGEQDAAPVDKNLQIKPPIVVREFAIMLGLKPFKLISELMDIGIFAGMNQVIEEDIAHRIAQRHGFTLEIRHRGEEQAQQPVKPKEEAPQHDDPALMEPRPPVVCVLGHVDHGKTTLLDSIRRANVASGEPGGITQHIGAYQVEHDGRKVTFLDTPGHAAFSKIRERGANVTDVAILIVAADDGFMPQTDEALKFAQKANVPVVVAINKTDARGANIDRVKQQMQERNIAPEDWGGETLCTPISALKGEGIPALLESVLLQAEILELKANPKCPSEGIIIESQIEPGRGCTATVIVRRGTLKVGDALVCGEHYCKVRAMVDENGKPVKAAPPATPVRLLGWSDAPPAGASFHAVKNEKAAKREAEENAEVNKRERLAAASSTSDLPTDLNSLLAAIDQQRAKVLRVIIKADVGGSAEALSGCLKDIKSDKVKLEVIEASVGQITKNDIDLAHSANACVVGFNVRADNGVSSLAKHHDVRIIQHNIIYELIDQVKDAMAELLDPEYRENKLGAAEIRQVFPVSKGIVAGCMVIEGIIRRDAHARISRKNELVYEGRIGTLKRFKDDVNEVRAGYECGVQLTGWNRYEEGDVIECFEILELRPSL